MYTQNPENFLNDVTNNIRFIGNNVFGISLDMVFSSATEDKTEAHALTVENAKEPTYIHEKE